MTMYAQVKIVVSREDGSEEVVESFPILDTPQALEIVSEAISVAVNETGEVLDEDEMESILYDGD